MIKSTVGSPTGEPVAVRPPSMPDLFREGPFDVHQDASELGASSQMLDSLPGCQYRMTAYDEENSRSDFSPAYGIHLHDPWLLEYVGAPDLAAALQLQHDAGLIMSNIQVLGQFVTSLNRMASEVMRVALDREPFASETV